MFFFHTLENCLDFRILPCNSIIESENLQEYLAHEAKYRTMLFNYLIIIIEQDKKTVLVLKNILMMIMNRQFQMTQWLAAFCSEKHPSKLYKLRLDEEVNMRSNKNYQAMQRPTK